MPQDEKWRCFAGITDSRTTASQELQRGGVKELWIKRLVG